MLASSEKTCKKYSCGILQCIPKYCFTCLQRWDSVTNVAANVKTITWKHGDFKEYLTESEIKRLEKVNFLYSRKSNKRLCLQYILVLEEEMSLLLIGVIFTYGPKKMHI